MFGKKQNFSFLFGCIRKKNSSFAKDINNHQNDYINIAHNGFFDTPKP